ILQIAGEDLSSSDIISVFSSILEKPALILHNPHVETQENAVTIRGSGAVAPFQDMDVAASFGLTASNQVTVLATVTAAKGKEIDWTLTQNFPALQGTLYEDIHFSDPIFTLSSEDTDQVKKGLFFSATLDFQQRAVFSGPQANLSWLWNNVP